MVLVVLQYAVEKGKVQSLSLQRELGSVCMHVVCSMLLRRNWTCSRRTYTTETYSSISHRQHADRGPAAVTSVAELFLAVSMSRYTFAAGQSCIEHQQELDYRQNGSRRGAFVITLGGGVSFGGAKNACASSCCVNFWNHHRNFVEGRQQWARW